jgi:hypothetical protein
MRNSRFQLYWNDGYPGRERYLWKARELPPLVCVLASVAYASMAADAAERAFAESDPGHAEWLYDLAMAHEEYARRLLDGSAIIWRPDP